MVQVLSLMRRTYLLEDVGLELFFAGRHSLYLTFRSSADRNAAESMPNGAA